MGYVSRAVPADLLNAVPPNLSPPAVKCGRERRLVNVFLSTLLAVPAFRALILQAVGLKGVGPAAEVFCDARFRDDPGPADIAAPNGLIRARGARGATALIDIAIGAFSADNHDEVKRIAEHLALARSRRIGRVITLSSTVPDQAFVAAVAKEVTADAGGVDRLRPLTWMDTVDIAFHLLERKAIDSQVGVFLLEQYIHCLKEEVVRETQARAERDQGALFFTSLGPDWNAFVQETAERGEIDPKDPRLAAIASNWLALVRSLSLYLTRGTPSDEDILRFPNVRARNLRTRRDVVLKRLRSSGQLLATFHKREEHASTIMCVDVRRQEVVFQLQLDGPSDKHGSEAIRDLAQAISENRTLGATKIKIFWPTEKTPRAITCKQAINEPISIAPPQHGMLPDRFIVERTVPCDKILREPDSFVQLLGLELRGFRASTRHLLHRGLPA